MRLISIISLAFLLVGCASTVYTPQDVYIPVKCIEHLPPKPDLVEDNYKNVIILQKAYLEMRLILSICTKEL